MSFRDWQHSPVVFWILAFFGIVGFFGTPFAIWAYWDSQRGPEITYYHQVSPIIDLDEFGTNSLRLNGQPLSQGTLTQNDLYIWNSGNQKITIGDIGVPIRLNFDSAGGSTEHLDVTYHGITAGQVEGEPLTGIRFTNLFPDSGIRVTFFTTSTSKIGLTGFVSGAGETSGLIKREKMLYSGHLDWFFLTSLAITWIIALVLWVVKHPKGFRGYWDQYGTASLISIIPAILLVVGAVFWNNFGLPPF